MSVFGPPLTSIPSYLLDEITLEPNHRRAGLNKKDINDKKNTAPKPENDSIPTHVFLIPYRNREAEMAKFNEVMPAILDKDIGKWEIIYIHQCNKWLFSRGSLFNIGFKEIQRRWPNDWRLIQIVLHDVDIYPTKPGVIDYNCGKPGIAKHPYGVKRPNLGGTVGGICILYGEDYAKVNGSPNYVGWGGEDVALYRRLKATNINIDEDGFIDRDESHPDVVDKESNSNIRTRNFNLQVTDKRNLTRAMNEDNSNPFRNSGLSSILPTSAELKHIMPPESPHYKQITMLDVKFEIMDLI